MKTKLGISSQTHNKVMYLVEQETWAQRRRNLEFSAVFFSERYCMLLLCIAGATPLLQVGILVLFFCYETAYHFVERADAAVHASFSRCSSESLRRASQNCFTRSGSMVSGTPETTQKRKIETEFLTQGKLISFRTRTSGIEKSERMSMLTLSIPFVDRRV